MPDCRSLHLAATGSRSCSVNSAGVEVVIETEERRRHAGVWDGVKAATVLVEVGHMLVFA